MRNADYAGNLALLTDTHAQVESLLHSLVQAEECIGLFVNTNKTDFMCFKQGTITTLSGKPLKLVDLFTYLDSNILSTESYINTCITKTKTDIERLSIKWISNLIDEIKRDFIQAMVVSVLQYG